MSYYRQFKEFDPLTGVVPYGPFTQLGSIVARARALLRGRTLEQIVSAAQSADFFIEEYFTRVRDQYIQEVLERGGWELGYLPEDARNEEGLRDLLDNWPSEAEDPAPDLPTPENTSELDALKECIGDWGLDDDVSFPNGQNYEYFAVMALWLVVDALRALERELERKSLPAAANAIRFSAAADCAISAMEAVCYAEELHTCKFHKERLADVHRRLQEVTDASDSLAEERARAKVSAAASRAAIQRNSEHRAMKEDVFAWCANHLEEYPSMDAAAEAIAGKLVPVVFRTARNWISQYRRQAK